MSVPLLHHVAGRAPAGEHAMWLSSKEVLGGFTGYTTHWVPGPGPLARPEPALHPVKAFHSSRARDITVRAPIRTSKSMSAAFECLHDLFPSIDPATRACVEDEIVVWAVGTDYETNKEWEYAWAWLAPRDFELVRALGGSVIQKFNTASSGNLRLVIEWGRARSGKTARSVLVGKSSKNETSLQGEEVRTACLSEAANHEQRIVTKYLGGRCKRILKPTTPKRSALWIYDEIVRGTSVEFVFARECNPTYDWQRFLAEKIRAELTWGNLENALDWQEQAEGRWVFAGGALIPFRPDPVGELPAHVIDETDPRWKEIADWLPFAEWYVSMDYGFTDPAVALLWAVGPEGQKVIYGELYQKGLHNGAFIAAMERKFAGLTTGAIREWIPDPQKPELTRLLAEWGLPVWTGLPSHFHRDRTASFRALIDALSIDETTGKLPLLIHARCQDLIREWKVLHKNEEWRGDEFAKGAVVGEDHALDAARYGALALRHARATRTNLLWLRRHEEAHRARLDREASYREWTGVRELRV